MHLQEASLIILLLPAVISLIRLLQEAIIQILTMRHQEAIILTAHRPDLTALQATVLLVAVGVEADVLRQEGRADQWNDFLRVMP